MLSLDKVLDNKILIRTIKHFIYNNKLILDNYIIIE